MHKTEHAQQRMAQRGIPGDLIGLALDYGRIDGDRYVLDPRVCDEKIKELKHIQKRLEHAQKKGGITVAVDGKTVITAFRSKSFCRKYLK